MSIADDIKAINALKKQAKDLGYTVSDAPVDMDSLNQLALGTTKINGVWNVVFVKYNIETGEARVEKTLPREDGKSVCAEQFKIEAALGLPVFQSE